MKAWALRPHRQAPQSQAAADRGFPSRSRAVEDHRSEPTAHHAAFALIQRSPRVVAQRQALQAMFGGSIIDHRPAAITQSALAQAIQDGPVMTARQALQAMFAPHVAPVAVLQRTEPKYIHGRLVSGEEQDKNELMDTYYPTWAYVDDKRTADRYAYPHKIPSPGWLAAWTPYEIAMEQAIKTWIASGREDFTPFAKGSNLWVLRNAVIAAGGLLAHGQQRPGPIPQINDPDELVVDAAVAAAKVAYTGWNRRFKTRGPFHTVIFTAKQIKMLSKRPQSYLGDNWAVHPSLTTRFALHKPGPANAEIDPQTNLPATFIFHVRSA